MKPAHAPDAPKPPKLNRSQNEDLERRLERLERRLESLDKKEGWGPEVHFNKDFKFEFNEPKFREQMAKMEKDFKFQSEGMNRVHEEARRAGELARREAEKAGEAARREAERAAEEVRKSIRETERDGKIQREARVEIRRQGAEHKARRKALEQHRRELEKQLEEVERELERAEREMEEQERQAEEKSRAEERSSVKRRATEDLVTH
jgi:chromosome segregation ATPase